MATLSSSARLHPRFGARFVFIRSSDRAGEYEVTAYLPDGMQSSARLRWDEAGQAELEPILTPAWVHEESLKLARVLRRNGQSKLIRWRGEPAR